MHYVYIIYLYGKSNARNTETKLIASYSPIFHSCDIPRGYCFHVFKAGWSVGVVYCTLSGWLHILYFDPYAIHHH